MDLLLNVLNVSFPNCFVDNSIQIDSRVDKQTLLCAMFEMISR